MVLVGLGETVSGFSVHAPHRMRTGGRVACGVSTQQLFVLSVEQLIAGLLCRAVEC